jgi:hypothetical protein
VRKRTSDVSSRRSHGFHILVQYLALVYPLYLSLSNFLAFCCTPLATWSLSHLPTRTSTSIHTHNTHPSRLHHHHGRSGQTLLGLCRSLAEARRRHHRERSESTHIATLSSSSIRECEANSHQVDVSSVATHFGTTYDTIENRLRPVKKQAKELKEAVSNGTQDKVVSTRKSPSKPKTPRKAATSFDGWYFSLSNMIVLLTRLS